MFKIKYTVFVIAFFLNFTCNAQYTDVINSNRPGESMSAFSVGKTVFQSEIGVSRFKEDHKTLNYKAIGYDFDLALRYGLFASQFESILNLQIQSDTYKFGNNSYNRSGVKKLQFGFKALILDPYKKLEKPDVYSWVRNNSFKWSQLIPAVAIYAGINLNFSNNPFFTGKQEIIDPKVMLITQNQFYGSQVFVTNFYADRISSDDMNLGYILTYTKGFNDHWSAFIENKGFKSKIYSDAIGTIGVAYLFKKSTQIDVSISKSLKNTPSVFYGGVGFSWRFDKNYKEDKIQIKKLKKPKKKQKVKPIETIPSAIPPDKVDPGKTP